MDSPVIDIDHEDLESEETFEESVSVFVNNDVRFLHAA